MRSYGLKLVAAGLLVATAAGAQQPQGAVDASKKIEGGGVHVQGWTGVVDKSRENGTLTISDAKVVKMGNGMHITTGPAATFYNPANKASGDYTVKAKFSEPKFQGLNSHPHPYGIMIGGNDLGTDQQSMLYCAAYGNGNFIVRGFAPNTPQGWFRVNGQRPEAHAAINKAEVGQPVTNEVAVSVKGDKVECAVNGTVVGSYNKADVIGTGKLKSTDGVYGIRIGHNAEAHVDGPTLSKP
jgi:hypothetical protein